jgi:putative hydrolase of the HAD superfamily
MTFQTILFDLDATLYPADNGFWIEIGKRIEHYLQDRMGIPLDKTIALKRAYYLQYGTTLRGLQHHHQIDPQDYLKFVHDIPASVYLQPDPPLREMLQSLPQHKWIFTNSDNAHATRILATLDLTDCFEGIISLESLDYECKPHPSVYHTALALAGETDPHRAVYLDDSIRNLAPAKDMGIFTIHVGPATHSGNGIPPGFVPDLTIARPHDLVQAMPELWVPGTLLSP